MGFTLPSGEVVYVPGVYTTEIVEQDAGGPTPQFHVPVLIGDAMEGIPFNATLEEHETLVWYTRCNTTSAARSAFGPDSDIATAMRWAKLHGLPYAFVVAVNGLTRASIIATSIGPVEQIKIFSRRFGTRGGWIKLKVVAGQIITISPPRYFTQVTADIGATDTRIYVRDNSWMIPGMSVELGDNNSANVARNVVVTGQDLGPTGQVRYFVDLASAPGALTLNQYASVAFYSTSDEEVSTALTDGNAIIAWFREQSEYLDAVEDATFNNAAIINIATSTPLKDIVAWTSVVVGTSPTSVLSDHQDLLTALDDSLLDEFALAQDVPMRSFLLLSNLSTVHAVWRTWAAERRTANEPKNIVCGGGWGDVIINAADDTDPIFRTAALDSQDVTLCAPGLDYLGANLSLAPAIWGRRMSGGVPHNLTHDALVFTQPEVKWKERTTGELTTLLRAGVATIKLTSSGQGTSYRVAQGKSTLQANEAVWNVGTNNTAFVMQRDAADHVAAILEADLNDGAIGADAIDASRIAAQVRATAERKLLRTGLITSYQITITEYENGGFLVDWSITMPNVSDFVHFTTRIRV